LLASYRPQQSKLSTRTNTFYGIFITKNTNPQPQTRFHTNHNTSKHSITTKTHQNHTSYIKNTTSNCPLNPKNQNRKTIFEESTPTLNQTDTDRRLLERAHSMLNRTIYIESVNFDQAAASTASPAAFHSGNPSCKRRMR
jgi:hypothetical protein